MNRKTGRLQQQMKNPDAVSGIEYPAFLLKFARRDLTRFISHLDWILLLQQAVFRSRLPAVLTEGFNKKLKVKYSQPLPTGVASEAEFAEIWISEPLEAADIFARLHDRLPRDIVLLDVIPLPPPAPKNPWKMVVAARYQLTFDPGESTAAREAVLEYLTTCRESEAVQQDSLKDRRQARKAGSAATYGGDENMMGTGGAVVPHVRTLFEEAGNPRDVDRAGGAKDIPEAVNVTEHYAKVLEIGETAAFLAGESHTLTLIGTFGPNSTLHAMRLCLTLQAVATLRVVPIPTKEAVLDRDGVGVY